MTQTPSIKNTALIIVIYNPDDSFSGRLERMSINFECIIIVDNSNKSAFLPPYPLKNKVTLLRHKKNQGLGIALNKGCQKAIAKNFKWCITLDQDSELTPFYMSTVAQSINDNPTIKILGCSYSPEYQSHSNLNKPKTVEVKTAITSGTLTNLNTWKNLGGFREDYFIDSIDHEFCLRARKNGVRVYKTNIVLMEHRIGDGSNIPILNLPFHHNSIRRYTLARNTTRTLIDYASSEPTWAIKKLFSLLIEVGLILFFENNKKRRSYLFFSGLSDGITGEFPDPYDKWADQ